MKLYELPRNTKFKIKGFDEIFTLDHIDGMYSFCLDKDGNVVHIVAYAEVDEVFIFNDFFPPKENANV